MITRTILVKTATVSLTMFGTFPALDGGHRCETILGVNARAMTAAGMTGDFLVKATGEGLFITEGTRIIAKVETDGPCWL